MEINIQDRISTWLKPAVGPDVYSSEWFNQRIKTIQSIATDLKVNRALSLVRYFLNKSDAQEVAEIDAVIQDGDVTFVRSGYLNKLIAGVCLVETLKKRSHASDAIALAFSTFTFEGKLVDNPDSELEADLLSAAADYLNKEMKRVRPTVRSYEDVEEYNKKVVSAANLKRTAESIVDPNVPDKPPLYSKGFNEVVENLTKVQNEVAERVNKLISSMNEQMNHHYDQILISKEETDFLWWLFGEFSRDNDKPLSDYDLNTATLIIGKEAADLTQLLPGHASAKSIIAKAVQLRAAGPHVEASALKDRLFSDFVNSDIPRSQEWLQPIDSAGVGDFCPIHRALQLKAQNADGWKRIFDESSNFKSSRKFTPVEISYQIHRERLLARAAGQE